MRDALDSPVRDVSRIVLPPASFLHEQEKIEKRWPAALAYIREHRLNEFMGGSSGDVGIILQGGLYNTLLRALELRGTRGLVWRDSELPLYVLNVTYPLLDEEIVRFCAGKQAILIVEEGQPEFIEQSLHMILRKADLQTKVIGKGILPRAGEYTGQVLQRAVESFLQRHAPDMLAAAGWQSARSAARAPSKEVQALASLLPARPAGFCTGCPERPIFTAMKLLQTGARSAAHQLRHRLPLVLDIAALQSRQHHHGVRAGGGRRGGVRFAQRQARPLGHGRWRLLAQRAHLGRRQRRVQ